MTASEVTFGGVGSNVKVDTQTVTVPVNASSDSSVITLPTLSGEFLGFSYAMTGAGYTNCLLVQSKDNLNNFYLHNNSTINRTGITVEIRRLYK